MENYKTIKLNSGRGHLWQVVIYDRFQIKGFDWENWDNATYHAMRSVSPLEE